MLSIALRSSRTLPGQLAAHSRARSASLTSNGPDAEAIAELVQEVLREARDVLGPLAQRRQLQRHHLQPIHQVLAKRAGAHALGEVAVRRRDDANIHRHALDPHPPRALRALAARAAACACTRASSSPTSSRNNVPPSASRNKPVRPWIAPVNAPFLCPNSSAAASSGLSAAQLKRTNGLSWRVLAAHHSLGQALFARAALARDQHGHFLGRDARHQHGQALHGLGAEHHRARQVELGLQALVVRVQPHRLDRTLHHRHQLVRLERLAKIVVRAFFDRVDCGALRAVRRDQDHARRALQRADPAQQLEPIELRHAQVGQHQVKRLLRQLPSATSPSSASSTDKPASSSTLRSV